MKDNNFIKKLILAAAAFIAQILIVMIIIFILLNKNIINVLTAFVLITVVFAIFVVLILNILRSIVVLLRGAIAGTASSDDKTAEKIKKVSARNDEVGEIVRNVTVAFEGITGTVAAIRNATVELEQVSEEFVAMFDTMHTVAASTRPSFVTLINPSFHTTSPGVRIILKNMVIRSSMKIVFRPLKINFTGTLDKRIIPARNIVATAYPAKVWNKNTDTINPMVPTSLVLGSSL